MKSFLLAVVVVAFAAAESQACLGQRRAARAKTVTKTKTVDRTSVLPVVRAVIAAPIRLAVPCPNCK